MASIRAREIRSKDGTVRIRVWRSVRETAVCLGGKTVYLDARTQASIADAPDRNIGKLADWLASTPDAPFHRYMNERALETMRKERERLVSSLAILDGRIERLAAKLEGRQA